MPTGRPSKLTDELTAAICKHVSVGATLKVAAQAEGINESTLTRWRQKGRDKAEPYLTFCTLTERARAVFETDTLRRLATLDEFDDIRDPESGLVYRVNRIDTKVATALIKSLTWLLERTRRERYGTQITVKVAEAKEHLLDTIERVCGRMGETAVLVAILEELERDGQPETGEAEGPERPDVH